MLMFSKRGPGRAATLSLFVVAGKASKTELHPQRNSKPSQRNTGADAADSSVQIEGGLIASLPNSGQWAHRRSGGLTEN